ncbi:hypothetical protein BC826DRAFT_1161654 [Russula brevipes]|nr:hypothetical protein BC826DRAFT_1161654 [Russula brevipes]
MSSPMSVERILSPSSEESPMASTPTQKPKGGSRPRRASPGDVELSVFDIHNIFRRRWFLSRANLLTNVISAQKDEDGNISWVEFTPQYHSHLLLNQEGHTAFFELQKGGRKANNAQKEKRCLARKRSRAAKREREREAAKAAKLPPHERQCESCGRKFNSRKTSRKHKCPKAKVVRITREAASEEASQATPPAEPDKPAAPSTSHAPPAPSSHSNVRPAVTGELQGEGPWAFINLQTGRRVVTDMLGTPVDDTNFAVGTLGDYPELPGSAGVSRRFPWTPGHHWGLLGMAQDSQGFPETPR